MIGAEDAVAVGEHPPRAVDGVGRLPGGQQRVGEQAAGRDRVGVAAAEEPVAAGGELAATRRPPGRPAGRRSGSARPPAAPGGSRRCPQRVPGGLPAGWPRTPAARGQRRPGLVLGPRFQQRVRRRAAPPGSSSSGGAAARAAACSAALTHGHGRPYAARVDARQSPRRQRPDREPVPAAQPAGTVASGAGRYRQAAGAVSTGQRDPVAGDSSAASTSSGQVPPPGQQVLRVVRRQHPGDRRRRAVPPGRPLAAAPAARRSSPGSRGSPCPRSSITALAWASAAGSPPSSAPGRGPAAVVRVGGQPAGQVRHGLAGAEDGQPAAPAPAAGTASGVRGGDQHPPRRAGRPQTVQVRGVAQVIQHHQPRARRRRSQARNRAATASASPP